MTRIKPPSPQKIWRFSSAHFWNIKLYHFKVVNVALVWYNKFIVRAEKSAKLISSSEWKRNSACFCKLIVYSRETLSGKV